jgi:uncharacterized protein (TIGR00299 family) protein
LRTLHFDCFSGISGDMTLAALIDAGAELDAVRSGLQSLSLPIELHVERETRNGISGLHVRIVTNETPRHRHLPDIEAIIAKGSLSPMQRVLALKIFRRLAEAEALAHGIPVEKVHFHEVGAIDSIADIVGTAIAVDSLRIERVTSRSVPPGSGTVKCEHGIMPVPAPATARLLQGVPLATVPVKGEMTTPTGAAILTSLVQEWTEQPLMTIDRIGQGLGTKDFPDWANVLRVFVGTTTSVCVESDQIVVLETNLDNTTGEIIGYCIEELFAAGAVDVFTTAIQMKKHRPGVLLTVLAPVELSERIETIIFRETGTLGIRRSISQRRKLLREIVTVTTPWGPIRVKRGWNAAGVAVASPEYEDCARVAREQGTPLRNVYAAVQRLLPESGR